MNYLASPPLVVAYALAGTMDIDLYAEPPRRVRRRLSPVFLRDLLALHGEEVARTVSDSLQADMYRKGYANVFQGDERWAKLEVPTGGHYAWDEISTYVRRPPFFDGMGAEPEELADFSGARALAVLGDSVTTDHISPAG